MTGQLGLLWLSLKVMSTVKGDRRYKTLCQDAGLAMVGNCVHQAVQTMREYTESLPSWAPEQACAKIQQQSTPGLLLWMRGRGMESLP